MNKTHLVINEQALKANYELIRSKLDDGCKVIGVVKANAYGTDAVSVAQQLITFGVDHLAVAYIDEGIQLRNAGISKPILVFIHKWIISKHS